MLRFVIFAIATALAAHAQQSSTVKPVSDDVTAYLEERRAGVKARADLLALSDENLQAGNYAEAEAGFRKLGDLESVARVYIAQGRTEEALSLLEAELIRSPGRPSGLADTIVKLGGYDRAIGAYRKALDSRTTPQSTAAIHSAIGDLYRRQGDLPSAIGAYRKAHDLAPENLQTTTRLADALAANGQKSEAAAEYAAVLGVAPGDSHALIAKALSAWDEKRDVKSAVRFAETANSWSPDDAAIADILGQLYSVAGDSHAAQLVFRALVAKAPRNPIYHYHLAVTYLQLDDRNQSVLELKNALDCNPPAALKAEIEQGLERLAKMAKQ
jgi:tetratricopeptide (TPR) repeat protein